MNEWTKGGGDIIHFNMQCNRDPSYVPVYQGKSERYFYKENSGLRDVVRVPGGRRTTTSIASEDVVFDNG